MSYLDEYGAGDERRERLVKYGAAALAALLVLSLIYYAFFRNWREEWQVHSFLSLLEEGKYEQAYELWGCSVESPCEYYPYDEFLEDWGPDSPLGQVESFDVGRSYEQQTGVIVEIRVNGRPHDNLWVESEDQAISFSPY